MQFEESEPWLRFPFADCLVFSNVSDLKSKCGEMFFSNVSPTKPSLSRPLIRYAFTTEAKKTRVVVAVNPKR